MTKKRNTVNSATRTALGAITFDKQLARETYREVRALLRGEKGKDRYRLAAEELAVELERDYSDTHARGEDLSNQVFRDLLEMVVNEVDWNWVAERLVQYYRIKEERGL